MMAALVNVIPAGTSDRPLARDSGRCYPCALPELPTSGRCGTLPDVDMSRTLVA